MFLYEMAAVVALTLGARAAVSDGIVDVTTLGAKNDGSADVSAIVNAATEKTALYFPPGRFTTTRMTSRFRPVDFGNLRTHDGSVRYRECTR